jgi:hypothetical protein
VNGVILVGLNELIADMTSSTPRLAANAATAVAVTSRKVQKSARARVRGHKYLPQYPMSITYDVRGGPMEVVGEIGPDKGPAAGRARQHHRVRHGEERADRAPGPGTGGERRRSAPRHGDRRAAGSVVNTTDRLIKALGDAGVAVGDSEPRNAEGPLTGRYCVVRPRAETRGEGTIGDPNADRCPEVQITAAGPSRLAADQVAEAARAVALGDLDPPDGFAWVRVAEYVTGTGTAPEASTDPTTPEAPAFSGWTSTGTS